MTAPARPTIEEYCPWCGAARYQAALRFEGPHATWCVHFREGQRGGSDEDRAAAARLPEPPGPGYDPQPARLPAPPIADHPEYRDEAHEPRPCDRCGKVYRGPAVYCSHRCAQADALDPLAGAFLDRDLACPDCSSPVFYAGPRGGMSRNYACAGCGARFNITIWRGAFVHAERI